MRRRIGAGVRDIPKDHKRRTCSVKSIPVPIYIGGWGGDYGKYGTDHGRAESSVSVSGIGR